MAFIFDEYEREEDEGYVDRARVKDREKRSFLFSSFSPC
jgi:hypothetical protein